MLFGLAAYLAQKGIDRSDGNLLGAAMFPLLGTGPTGLCLSAYERGVRSTYNLAQAVLQSRSAALQTPNCERCETCEDARAQMVVAEADIGCGQSVSALGRFRALPNSTRSHSAVDLNESVRFVCDVVLRNHHPLSNPAPTPSNDSNVIHRPHRAV